MTASLADRVDSQIIDERRRVLRALLRQSLLTMSGSPVDCALVRKHADWLCNWFARWPNWTLRVDSETARLEKTVADREDYTRGAYDFNGRKFSRRRYALLCLTLAALERSDRQTTLGEIATSVVGMALAEDALAQHGIAFKLDTRDQRRDLVAAMRLLLSYHVLRRVDGDEDAFVQDRGDVLYNINRSALTAMLNVRFGPSMVDAESVDERIEGITAEMIANSEDAKNQRRQHQLVRRLIDDPVLYYADLDANDRDYLTRQRHRLIRAVTEATGMIAEIRAEGIAMVDDSTSLTDLSMPEEGTDGHIALLLAEFLAAELRSSKLGSSDSERSRQVSRSRLERLVADLRDCDERTRCWRKDAREPGSEVGLVEQALQRLAGLRLVQLTAESVIPLPAVARFAMAEPTVLWSDTTSK